MIDISHETLLTMAEASALLPGRPSLCALWRWRSRGVRGRKLETIIVGGRPYTSIEAIARFARHEGGTDELPVRTPAARERAIRKADRELADDGI